MNKNITTLGLTLAAGLALAACQYAGDKRAEAPLVPPAPIGSSIPQNTRPTTEIISRVDGPVDGYAYATLLARQRLTTQTQGPQRLGVEPITTGPRDARPVSLSFDDLDARDVLRVLIGQFLGRSYLIDPSVKGPVTLDVHADLSTQDLYDLLDALAIVHGWSIETRGQTLVVRDAKHRATTSAAPILTARSANPSERPGVRVYPVNYLAPQQASEAIKPMLSTGGALVLAGRLIVVADTLAQLNRFGDLLAALDTPAFDGVDIWTYELANQTPADAAKVLETIARQSGMSAADDALATFVPLPQTQKLMVISRDATLQPMIQQWIEIVDQPADLPRRQDYVYHIQYLNPGELKTILDSFYAGRIEKNVNDPNDNRMRLIVSNAEDLLLIKAIPRDYADVMALLERIDRPRQQVLLQAIIAEVTLSDSLDYGVEYFLTTSKANGGNLDLTGSVNQFSPANPAASAVFLATSGFALIEALKTKSNVSVLSSPHQLVRDKDPADLKVGASVPIIKASQDSATQTAGNTGIRNEVEYRDTGVILGVTPAINESGDVTMTIKLEVTDAVPTTSSGIDSPTFTTRTTKTTVIVPTGKTVLLAGAIESRKTDRNDRIPLLGDIPGLGAAFQTQDHQSSRTELLLAITPTIINEPADAQLALSDFVSGAYNVRAALNQFIAPIPTSLRVAKSSAPQDIQSTLAPVSPAPRNGSSDLMRLATSIHASSDDRAALVAQFLEGLATQLPQPGES